MSAAASADGRLTATDVTFAYGSGPEVVKNVSIDVAAGSSIGIVGESGSGKTTLGSLLVGMLTPTRGSITINGRPWTSVKRRDPERFAVQMVFQNPYTALNPRQAALSTVAEVFHTRRGVNKSEALASASELLSRVGLGGQVLDKRPGDLSGGQCQRIGIARALAANPSFIVADEPTSALDVSVQAQILNLLSDLRQEQGIGLVLITHDLNVVSYLTDTAIVMQRGEIVESGSTNSLLAAPSHAYTQKLVASVL